MNAFDWSVVWYAVPYLCQGAVVTLELSALAMLFGTVLGAAAGLLSLAENVFVRGIVRAYVYFVRGTPALSEYWHRMWMRHEDALSRVLAAETGAPEADPGCAALAHFALETSALAIRSEDPARTVEAAFAILEHGWRASPR